MQTQIVFYEPLSMDSAWVRGDLWGRANALPGVAVISDPGGGLIKAAGTFTSGQTLLYASSGELLFKGGITASRGHEGDNAGRSALLAIIEKNQPDQKETFVFGCSIWGENA